MIIISEQAGLLCAFIQPDIDYQTSPHLAQASLIRNGKRWLVVYGFSPHGAL